MKNLVHLLTVAVFVLSVSMAVAGEQGAIRPQAEPAKAKAGVNCCLKGKCGELPTKAECEKRGGKVVQNCKDCK